ncbi:hypothetical protein MHTCC0001_27530 [Flavobacteriaceae bacterium MHTCC 0001]
MKKITLLFILSIALISSVNAQLPSLNVDFGEVSGIGLESGYELYDATDNDASSYGAEMYSAFGTTVTFQISFSSGVANGEPAFRGSADDLAVKNALASDLCAINKGSSESIIMTFEDLPAGNYEWTSYHHGPWWSNWSVLADLSINNGTTTVTLEDISHSGNASTEVATATLNFTADGTNDVVINLSNADTDPDWVLISGFDLVQTGPLSVDEVSLRNNFSVIKTGVTLKDTSGNVQIIDLLGRTLVSKQLETQGTLDFTFKSGTIYLVKLTTSLGSATKKVAFE